MLCYFVLVRFKLDCELFEISTSCGNSHLHSHFCGHNDTYTTSATGEGERRAEGRRDLISVRRRAFSAESALNCDCVEEDRRRSASALLVIDGEIWSSAGLNLGTTMIAMKANATQAAPMPPKEAIMAGLREGNQASMPMATQVVTSVL